MPSSGTADVSPTPSGASWGHINAVSRPLIIDAYGGTLPANIAYSPDGGADATNKNALFAQFVSQILPPQTYLAATIWGIGAYCSEVSANNNLFLTWTVYVVDVPGTSVLGTICSLQRDGTEVNQAGADTGRSDFNQPATDQVISVPHRIVLEIGLGGTPNAGNTHNGTIRFGETTELAQNLSTVSSRPWLQTFGSDIKLFARANQLVNSEGLVG